MRILKPKGFTVDIDGKERELIFTLNAIDEIQEHYDKPLNEVIRELFGETEEERRNSYKMLVYITTVLFNEDIENHNDNSQDKWEFVTEKYVGRKLNKFNFGIVALIVLNAFNASLPKSEEDEDDDPNETTEQ